MAKTIKAYEDRNDDIELVDVGGHPVAVLREEGALLCGCGATLARADISPDEQYHFSEVGITYFTHSEMSVVEMVPILGWTCPACRDTPHEECTVIDEEHHFTRLHLNEIIKGREN